MRWSACFIPTQKKAPADAECASHSLLVRAGYVWQLSAGLYAKLPLAVRAIAKIECIIDEEMARIGGQRFHMPALHPAEPWVKTGRWETMGEAMLRLQDRAGRDLCLGPTHEEIFTLLASTTLQSYRDVSQIWYQVQSKFRDEPRPRSGVIRTREFLMKDAYSFDYDEEGLGRSYDKHVEAYTRIFRRCGLRDVIAVQASSGAMGGKSSHEFIVSTTAGEDTIVRCACGYAANVEAARTEPTPYVDEDGPSAPTEVATPNAKTIDEVSALLAMAPARLIKSLVYVIDGALVLLLVRGEDQLNEEKVANLFGTTDLRAASGAQIEQAFGAGIGSLGPLGVEGIEVVADRALEGRHHMVCGANRDGFHLVGVTPGEHFTARFEDIRLARDGDQCAACGGTIEIVHGLELGHTFKLGTRYSDAFDLTVLGVDGQPKPIVMGSYGIGLERILAAAVEQNHDENGFVLPATIAPFELVMTPVNVADEAQRDVGERLYTECTARGIDVLLDDRDRRAGFKFKDADLIGVPFRITIGPKGLPSGVVEFVDRVDGSRRDVPIDEATAVVASRLDELKQTEAALT